jgi:hypothetical protein
MNDKNPGRAYAILLTLLVTATVAATAHAAEELSFRKNVADYWVYLTVMPAELISGPPPSEPGAMPFQPPAARDMHHVMVSLFDYRSGRRVTDAEVEARVAALGFSGTQKALESTSVAGAPLYAGLFPMIGRGPFRIDVEFRTAEAKPQHATFYFRHPSFARPKAQTRKELER